MKRCTHRMPWRLAMALLLAALLLSAQALALEAGKGELTIRVAGIAEQGDKKTITLAFDNQTDCQIRLGWGGDGSLVVETTEGTYSLPINSITTKAYFQSIEHGVSTITLTLKQCPGTVKKVALTNLRALEPGSELPDYRLNEALIYQEDLTDGYAWDVSAEVGPEQALWEQWNDLFKESHEESDPVNTQPELEMNFPFEELPSLPVHNSADSDQREKQLMEATFQQLENGLNFTRIFSIVFPCIMAAVIIAFIYTYRKQRYNSSGKIPSFGTPTPSEPGQSVHWTFSRRNMLEKEFIQRINQWFQENSNVTVTSSRLICGSGEGIFTKKTYLNGFEIDYHVRQGGSVVTYGLEMLSKLGLWEQEPEVLIRPWQEEHPGAVIENSRCILHQRSSGYAPHGLGANNLTQIYLFYCYRTNPAGETPRSEEKEHRTAAQQGFDEQHQEQYSQGMAWQAQEQLQQLLRDVQQHQQQEQLFQQDVQQFRQQQVDQFAWQSVTQIQDGGFIPPPPPPPQ